MNNKLHLFTIVFMVLLMSCNQSKNTQSMNTFTGAKGEVKLINLQPGHFHAALVQKTALPQINDTVYVYASGGPELENYLGIIEGYNIRQEKPTKWTEIVYEGDDFFEKMLEKKNGNVVVISGNNRDKTEYIHGCVNAGLHVLADKPMAINTNDFQLLKEAFDLAQQNDVLLYDIMTERFEITTLLQKEMSLIPSVFGELVNGTEEEPAVTKESVHHFFKYVSGKEIVRPGWFFDVKQQGEGIVDVTTHLVDLIQWECFPEITLDYQNDVEITSAYRWPTVLSKEQFARVTRLDAYPDYIRHYMINDSLIGIYANGEINYTLKGKHAKVVVKWNYEAPAGTKDTHFSIMRGTKATLVIRQGEAENYETVLYIEPEEGFKTDVADGLATDFNTLQEKYPGISLEETSTGWKLNVPDRYKVGHEAHFGQVTEKFLGFLIDGELPEWEVPNMIAKYYTTTKALELAVELNPEKNK